VIGECGTAVPLPAEVWEEVFGWLDNVRDLCSCTATCRTWAALCWRHRRHVRLTVGPINEEAPQRSVWTSTIFFISWNL
jgi:hypothetical protein